MLKVTYYTTRRTRPLVKRKQRLTANHTHTWCYHMSSLKKEKKLSFKRFIRAVLLRGLAVVTVTSQQQQHHQMHQHQQHHLLNSQVGPPWLLLKGNSTSTRVFSYFAQRSSRQAYIQKWTDLPT